MSIVRTTNKQTSSERRLVAILFADIEGYTAIMQKDEESASILLRRFQNETEEKVKAHDGRIVQFYGDGVLCIFQNPLEAIRCAITLQMTFKTDPSVPVRIGIHSGTVVFEGAKIFGDSVNITSRIESMGIPGAVLFSKKVRDDIKNQSDFNMVSLGSFEFKNVDEPLEVFALANEGFQVPKMKDLKGKFKEKDLSFVGRLRRDWKFVASLTIVLFIGIVGINHWLGKPTAGTERWRSSIAILPFENPGNQPEEEYFFNGIADEIRSQLAVVKDLKVISRSSSMLYKDENLTLREIAKKLGVTYILTGRIQHYSDLIKINVELNNAATDALEWSLPAMDRKMENIFTIQTEIAQEVVHHLKLELSPQEKSMQVGKTEQPSNVNAYEYFLKGRYIYHVKYLVSGMEDDFIVAKQLLEKALALDPQYASAYGVLADLHDAHGILFNFHDSSIWKKDFKTRDSLISVGYKINSDNPYLQLAKGWSFIEPIEGPVNPDHPNMDSAFQLFKKILVTSPEDPFINLTMGNFLGFNVGLFQRAKYYYLKALELDPLREDLYVNLISYTIRLGQYQEAEDLAMKVKEIAPGLKEADLYVGIAYAKKGDIMAARKKLQVIGDYKFNFWDSQLLLGRLYLLTSQSGKALEIYKEAGSRLHVLLLEGKKEEALEYINTRFNTYSDIWYTDLLYDDIFNSIRQEPAFHVLMEKAQLIHQKRQERFQLSYL